MATLSAERRSATRPGNSAYDELDRPLGILPVSNGRPVLFSYRPDEIQLESETDNSYSYRFEHDYDDLGRVARKTHTRTGTSTDLLLDFEYDLLGRTTQIVYPDTSTVVNYVYSGAYLKSVCEVSDPAKDCDDPSAIPHLQDVVYDDLGRRSVVTMPPGVRAYDYSASTHRLTQDNFSSAASGYAIDRVYSVYDEIGNLRSLTGGTFQNGSPIPGDPVVGATFTYDRRNRISSWSRAGSDQHYAYDSLGNLVGYATDVAAAQNQGFGENGNGPHAVTSSMASGPSVTFSYDPDGNLESAVGGPVPRFYSFDWANRLVGVGPTAGSDSELSVDYDASGERIRDVRATGTRVFVDEYLVLEWDDAIGPADRSEIHIRAFDRTIALKVRSPVNLRTASSPAWLSRWNTDRLGPWAFGAVLSLSALRLGALIVRVRIHIPIAARPGPAAVSWVLVALLLVPSLPAGGGGGGGGSTVRRWLVTDHLGSGVVWLDSSGMRVRHTEFAPFGKIHEEFVSSGAQPGPTLYAGHRRDEATGLDYMQARWYSARTATFLGVDPVVATLGDPQSYNAYSYARNNPMTLVDPHGTNPTPGQDLLNDPSDRLAVGYASTRARLERQRILDQGGPNTNVGAILRRETRSKVKAPAEGGPRASRTSKLKVTEVSEWAAQGRQNIVGAIASERITGAEALVISVPDYFPPSKAYLFQGLAESLGIPVIVDFGPSGLVPVEPFPPPQPPPPAAPPPPPPQPEPQQTKQLEVKIDDEGIPEPPPPPPAPGFP